MKRLLLIAGALCLLAVLLAGAAFIVGMNMGRLLKHAVSTYGPELMKTEVRLGDADVRLLDGQATLKDIYIGNPLGFSLPKLLSAHLVFVCFKRASLLGGPLVIERLEIDSPDIAYEKTVRTDNFKALLKNMGSSSAAPAGETGTAAPSGKKKKRGRKVVIRDLVIRNTQVTVIMAPRGGKKQTLILSELRLKNIGGTSGSRPEEIVRQVFAALYETNFINSGR